MTDRIRVLAEAKSAGDGPGMAELFGTTNGNGHTNGKGEEHVRAAKMFGSALNTYLQGLSSIGMPAAVRARDPFMNHPWIFAAAMTTAIVASQAPLKIYRESERALDRRMRQAKAFGRPWTGPKAGRARRAFHRHLDGAIDRRFSWKNRGIEEDLEHPLMDVLMRPNPYQDGEQFEQYTDLWYALRGECFVLPTNEDGQAIGLGETPAQLWPYGPDYFTEILSEGNYGRLIGWWFSPPTWSHISGGGFGRKVRLDLHQVYQFKSPNPMNPLRGMARTTPAAMAIETDLAINLQHRALLKNNSVPRGVMKFVGEGDVNETELQDKEDQIAEKTKGEARAGETLFLPKGWEYQVLGLSPKDMQDLPLLTANREAELAVMGVPMSVLGVADFKTYATQLGQDKNFWDKLIVPMKRSKERTWDNTLLYPETDSTFAAYDVRGVEALRAGLEHKVMIAEKLSGQRLHMPPRMAYEHVDLEVESYEGIDETFEQLGGEMVDEIPANGPPKPKPAEPTEPGQEKPTTPADGEDPESDEDEKDAKKARQEALRGAVALMLGSKAPAAIIKVSKGERVIRVRSAWNDFVKIEAAIEKKMRGAYRAWVEDARRDILRRFDQATGRKADDVNLSAVLPDPEDWEKKLKGKSRPVHFAALEATWNLTVDEIGGVPTFEIDDDRIVEHFERRERRFVGTTTAGLIKRVRKTLEAGQASGETIQEMRTRLSQAMDVAAGSAKTLTVARTESAGFMNGVRDEMFGLQGFTHQEWSSAGDEHVREDHVTFEQAGAKERGFDYLSLVGGGAGRLRFPGDMEAPASQTVNCRCTPIPAEGEAKSARHAHDQVVARELRDLRSQIDAIKAKPEIQPVHVHLEPKIDLPSTPVHLTLEQPKAPAVAIRKDITREGGVVTSVLETPVPIAPGGGA